MSSRIGDLVPRCAGGYVEKAASVRGRRSRKYMETRSVSKSACRWVSLTRRVSSEQPFVGWISGAHPP